MNENDILELINRRRRQILLHSIIYYRFHDNLIDDYTWSQWAMELTDLQNRFPNIAKLGVYADEFENFDGSTGFDLPLYDEKMSNRALHLLRNRDKFVATFEK